MFSASSDNEVLKAVYGNYGLWAWLRYWYLDTENYITLVLADKGYYDYDYEAPKGGRMASGERHERTHEQTQSVFSRMGFGRVKRVGETESETGSEAGPMSAEEMQRAAMAEISGRKVN